MRLPELTLDQIQDRCTAQSFARGEDYFNMEMIGNPILHGCTLASTCEGTEEEPYRVSVELTPTGIADTKCSCPYDWGGDCKHVVALLLTYMYELETISSLDALLIVLAEKPKETLLRVISELLTRSPELVDIARFHADIPEAPEEEIEPIPPELSVYVTVVDKEMEEFEEFEDTELEDLGEMEELADPQNPAIPLYHSLIEQKVLSGNRKAYEEVLECLIVLREIHEDLDLEDEWTLYLENFRKRHARKRVLLQMMDAQHL